MSANANLTPGKLIAVDWGTSRLRARLVDGAGAIVAETMSDQGIGTLSGAHEAVFEEVVAGWPDVPAIMAGMVGSREGWREAAYVACPATVGSITAAMMRFTTVRGRPVTIVPGLKVTTGEGNVLRGEETQIVGALEREPGFSGTCVLPGTHSKWVRVERGAIVSFESFISGELFELLARRSLLRHSVGDPVAVGDVSEVADFRRAVERVTRGGVPFLAALFSVRVRQLLADVKPADDLAYLSGLVIGGEVAAAVTLKAIVRDTPIRVIGASALGRAYKKALAVAGYEAVSLDGDEMVLAGLVHLARVTGLVPGVTA